MKITNFTAGCLSLVALAAALPAQAAPPPVPASTTEGSVYLQSYSPLSGPGSSLGFLTAPGTMPGFTSSTGSSVTGLLKISGTPLPLVSAEAYLTTTDGAGGQANIIGFEKYHFRIDGPADTVLVRINALGDLGIKSVTASGSATARGFLRIQEANGGNAPFVDQLIGAFALGGQIGGTFDSFAVNDSFLFKTNTIYDVTMDARLTIFAGGGGVTDAFVHLDPMFTVDGPYSFVFSDGFGGGVVNGGGAVPEPATWAMMIIGFSAAGSMIRRRKAVIA